MNLLFDIRVLANGSQKDRSRSGIYFTSYNILLQFLKNKNFNVSFYCGHNKTLYQNICDSLSLPHSADILDDKDDFSQFDAYFSPAFATPPALKNTPYLPKFFILYDVIPLLKPQYFSIETTWFFELLQDIDRNSHYFSISESTKKDFINYMPSLNPNHITTIPLAASSIFYPCDDKEKINNVKLKYKIPLDKRYILSICTLEPRKNLIKAIQSFIKFVNTNNITDMVYVLGGANWPKFFQQFKKILSEYAQNEQDTIFPIGYVDDEDMAPLYSGADFFVYTSLYEGFGLPVLESMKCGTPVITSNVTSLPEIAKDAALTIDPVSIDAHIDAFTQFYYNDKLRKEYILRGINRSKTFTWEKCEHIISKTIIKYISFLWPDISVITVIPYAKKEQNYQYITRCIESVQSQTYPGKIEHIIVVPHLTKELQETLKRYQNIKQIHIISVSEKDFAWTKGIEAAQGQYIAFLHIDSFYHQKNGLYLSIRSLYYSNVECCTTDVFLCDGQNNLLRKGGFSQILEGIYPSLDGMVILYTAFQHIKCNLSISKDSITHFLMILSTNITSSYSQHCYVTSNSSVAAPAYSQSDLFLYSLLFYQSLGKNYGLNLYDCLTLITGDFFKKKLLPAYFCRMLEKIPNADWISNFLNKNSISTDIILKNSRPINGRDIFNYIRYKLYSHFFFGKRTHYKEKYKALKDSLKKLE